MNINNKTYSTSSGKDVKDTSKLKGEARETADFKSKNETTEYVAERGNYGTLGGKNTGGG